MSNSKNRDLSLRQREILSFIQKALDANGYPPSVREIGEAVGLKSSSTVHSHLVQMERKGFIKRDPTKPRAIEIVGNHNGIVRVPVIGRVTAGQPVLAYENIEEILPLPISFLHNSDNVFILRVQGESMINAGILNNDFVLVKQQQFAENGDIVVALIGEEATVKRFFQEEVFVRLQPENPDFEPILTKDVKILGKVIGLLRKMG